MTTQTRIGVASQGWTRPDLKRQRRHDTENQ